MVCNSKQLELLPIKQGESIDNPLRALIENRCVVLSIKDNKMRLKKRVQNPVLMIAPTAIYGSEDGLFLFSMPGYGSEIINIKDMKPTTLYRLGMTMRASGILVKEINLLLEKH